MHLVDQVAGTNRLTHRHPIEKAMLAGGLGGIALFVQPWPGAVLVLGTVTAAAVGIARLPVRAWCTVLLWPASFLIAGGGVTALAVDPTAMVASVSLEGAWGGGSYESAGTGGSLMSCLFCLDHADE